MKSCIVGGGSWGIALYDVLINNNQNVFLYVRDDSQVKFIKSSKKSSKYLKDYIFPDVTNITSDLKSAVTNSKVVVLATPFQSMESVLNSIKPYIDDNTVLVNVSKGLHLESYKTGYDFVSEIFPNNRYVVLSGPSHAEEVSKKMITTVVSSSDDLKAAELIQDIFMNEYFRVYIHPDVRGVEIAGALKNVIAIGSGVLYGVKAGDNARAALITRGLFEISKLGLKMGASMITFMGLTGMGDLIVTATSKHSRNFRAGVLIGEGVDPMNVENVIGETVEGLKTVRAAHFLAQNLGVDMPITNAIYEGIYEKKDPHNAIMELMTRSKKHEFMQGMEL